MYKIEIGSYRIYFHPNEVPGILYEYRKRARLYEHFGYTEEGSQCLFAIAIDEEWPRLVVTQRYEPAGYGFEPGCLIVPETGIAFIGAGTRLLAYDSIEPRRIWEDTADMGFYSWRRHSEVIVMSAELELSAWDIQGQKLWTTFVEPPWQYNVQNGEVVLDVMGKISTFSLYEGPSRR